MNWHPDALTKECLASAGKLAAATWLKDFYLAGGTALALWYGHRISVDLDFFAESNPLEMVERQTLIAHLTGQNIKIEEEKDGTVHARDGQTHLSFFRYRYPLLKPLSLWNGINVADPIDIGLMKLGAIIGRGSKKDFYDMATLFDHGVSLKQLLRAAKKKFTGHLDLEMQVFRALVYFEDAEKEPAPNLKSPRAWSEVKKRVESEVRSVVDK